MDHDQYRKYGSNVSKDLDVSSLVAVLNNRKDKAPDIDLDSDTLQGLSPTDFVLRADAYKKLVENSIDVNTIDPIGMSTLEGNSIAITTNANIAVIYKDGVLYTATGNKRNTRYLPYCNGRVSYSQIEAPTGLANFKKIDIPPRGPITKIGGFREHLACILYKNGELFVFGKNGYGQSGCSHTTEIIKPRIAAVDIIDFWAINRRALFVKDKTGTVYASGSNMYGLLGINKTSYSYFSTRQPVVGIPADDEIMEIFASDGWYNTWFFTKNKKIYFSGYDGYRQSGSSTTSNKTTLIDVTSNWVNSGKTLDKIKVLTSNYSVFMWLKYTDGTSELKTCGYGGYGQLGNGAISNITTPYTIYTGTDIKDIGAVGQWNTITYFYLKDNGELWVWGCGTYGQTGLGARGNVSSPTISAVNVDKIFNKSIGIGYTSFIKTKDNKLLSCGYNNKSQCGFPKKERYITTWRQIPIPDSKFIHTLAWMTANGSNITPYVITVDSDMYAWGCNKYDQISSKYKGDEGDTVESPVLISLPT